MRTAIAQKADVITLLAQDPALLGPQIEQAEAAGIPVVVVRTTSEGESCPPQGAACVPGPFEQAGRLEADWAISRWDGRAGILVITSNDAPSTAPLMRGLRDEFAMRCVACRLRSVDVPIAKWAERIQSEVQSALVADPQIGFVIPIYDSMAQFVVPAIVAAGMSGRVTVGAFNGRPSCWRWCNRMMSWRWTSARTRPGSGGGSWIRCSGSWRASGRCRASTHRSASSMTPTSTRRDALPSSPWVTATASPPGIDSCGASSHDRQHGGSRDDGGAGGQRCSSPSGSRRASAPSEHSTTPA